LKGRSKKSFNQERRTALRKLVAGRERRLTEKRVREKVKPKKGVLKNTVEGNVSPTSCGTLLGNLKEKKKKIINQKKKNVEKKGDRKVSAIRTGRRVPEGQEKETPAKVRHQVGVSRDLRRA